VSVGGLFDPPIGFKTFDDKGLPVMQYRMVWINSGNTTAINVQISDTIPTGTTYVPGTFTCSPQGSSANAVAAMPPLNAALTNSYCAYDPAAKMVQWQGSIGPDDGKLTEADAANEVILTFQVRVDDATGTVSNFATSRTDINGNADFTDNSVIGTSMILSNMATWTRSASSDSSAVDEVELPSILPKTGFAPYEWTILPNQPTDKSYSSTGQWLEIPRLGVNIPLVGVPLVNGAWDISWLTRQAGWLNGTAFPTWSGNSVLTSHVFMSDGKPGPFINLGNLKYGDQIIIHAYGNAYTYEVRENKVVTPEDVTVLGHKDQPWLTLITCKKYIESANKYESRVAVQAVLVSVAADQGISSSDRKR
jgi:LPXTG-site transpeptidase (sortase) family protein